MSAHKNFLHTSDFILTINTVVFLMIEVAVPTSTGLGLAVNLLIGVISIAIAWVVIFLTKCHFKRHNQKTGPGHETKTLITGGIFKYSRNPIYLAVALIEFSLIFLIDSLWLIPAIFSLVILINILLIYPEEKYLGNKFGDLYKEYRKSTRRWI